MIKLPNYTKKKFEELDELKKLNVLKLTAKDTFDKIVAKISKAQIRLDKLLVKPKNELEKLKEQKTKLTDIIVKLTKDRKTEKSKFDKLEKDRKKHFKDFTKSNDKLEKKRIDNKLLVDTLETSIEVLSDEQLDELDKFTTLTTLRKGLHESNQKLKEEIKEKNKELLAIADNKKHLCKK